MVAVIQMSDRELTRLRVMIDLADDRLTVGAAATLAELNRAIRELVDQLNDRPMRGWATNRGSGQHCHRHEPGDVMSEAWAT
jgi:hypothetical protein